MKTVIKRLAGFAGFPLLSAVVPLFVMPILARLAGEQGWSSISSGLAIGIFSSTVIVFGWNIDGPVRLARTPRSAERLVIYGESLSSRLVLCAVVFPITTLLAGVISAPSHRLEAILIALASASGGLSPAWYFIGTGNPRLLGFVDTIPRVVASVASIPLLLVTEQIWTYAVMQLAATAVTLWFFFQAIPGAQGNLPSIVWSRKAIQQNLRSQMAAAGLNLAGNAYGSTPVPIATATVSGTAASNFASGDQLYRYALFPVSVLANAFQSWTLEVAGEAGRRRQLAAITAHTILGIVGGVLLASLGPLVSGLMFGPNLATNQLTAIFYGLALCFLSIAAPLQRNLLIPNGRGAYVFWVTVTAAATGVTTMLVFGQLNFVEGIAFGMAASEALVLILLLPASIKTFRAN
ncbi:O-antigen/teichoic acid export membrane protein [Arthrobacter sp. B2I5]|uniref:lipopolysaccharide biosynthesis protein n=1 Tax=Arthrobacter sp. B2I5 TaxID=3042266 RepID=UPI00277D6EDF|nr:polysaccharide biosynthesis protein [Arthrobacter sp. B2I5]MDQ0825142.1 O-antigen/teichoic acid export membrane protein [Arthrobacter sp. B2I5]